MSNIFTRVKKREVPWPLLNGQIVAGKFFRDLGGIWVQTTDNLGVPASLRFTPDNAYSSSQVTRDQGDHQGPPWTSGGPFETIKIVYDQSMVLGIGDYNTGSVLISDFTGNHRWRYVGGFYNPQFTGDLTPYSSVDLPFDVNPLVPSVSAFGPQVYPRLRPNLEKAGVMVALAEARDVPRMLKETSKGFHDIWNALGGRLTKLADAPKKLADQFLNIQFGWMPFLKDMRQINNVYQNSAEYVLRVKKENNQWVKRKWTFNDYKSRTIMDSGVGLRCEPLGFTMESMFEPGTLKWEQSLETINRVIAVGRFKYYRPEFDDSIPSNNSAWNTIQQQMLLYGARINPSNVYKATPWTWLIDWFTNVGDQVLMAQDWALDSMVSKYMYLMQEATSGLHMYQTMQSKNGPPATLEWRRMVASKQRWEADSPYGFSLRWELLSPRQIAILASLGISRLR